MEYVYILNICTTSISIIHFIYLLTLCNWNDHVEKMINTKKILEKWTKFIEWQSKINGQYNKVLVFLLMC